MGDGSGRPGWIRASCGTLLVLLAATTGGCSYTPAELGITGPQPGGVASPPPVVAGGTADAVGRMPGLPDAEGRYAPSIRRVEPQPGQFYGSD